MHFSSRFVSRFPGRLASLAHQCFTRLLFDQLLSPHIAPTLNAEKRTHVIDVCKKLIEKLRIASADEAHAPHSYAVFLEKALKNAVPEPPTPSPTSSPES